MAHIVDFLPMKHTSAEIVTVNKLSSERETSGLADTKSQFQHDPISVAAKHRYVLLSKGESQIAQYLIFT